MLRARVLRPLAIITSLTLATGAAFAQPDPSGIEFVTITHAGNAPWPGAGFPGDVAVGRGRVDYEYRIGKYEVTTSQWTEFFNASFDRPANDRLPYLIPPTFWGAVATTPNTPGGRRWAVPAGNEMMPVGDISWRMAAMYANWLHNDKRTDRAAFMNGAYDVSTFGFGTPFGFSDQLTRNPDAKYWIPTWDEWLKAAHYDPNKVGGAGWWMFADGSDDFPVYGPPGVLVNGQPTEANAGWDRLSFPGYEPFAVPLGAYPDAASPWGLLDVAGGTSEWTEEVMYTAGIPTARRFDGSYWSTLSGPASISDRVIASGGDFPSLAGYDLGFRIASSVPAVGPCALFAPLALWSWRRNRRR